MTTPARQTEYQVVHYLRKKSIAFGSTTTQSYLGTIPANSLILKPDSGVHVVTAFNAGTTNTLDIGTTTTTTLWGSALALGTTTFVPLDEAVGGYRVTVDTDVYYKLNQAGTAATTGDADIVISYIPHGDRD